MNTALQEYIKAQLAYRVAKSAIIDALLGAGWTQIDVDEAFALLDPCVGRNGAGVHAQPEFFGKDFVGEDGTTILEEKIVTSDPVADTPARARFPEGLKVMPQPVDSLRASGKIEMRPAEIEENKRSMVNGLLYTLLILLCLITIFGFIYFVKPSIILSLWETITVGKK